MRKIKKQQPMERYISPYTDFGFKLLFGTEMNKELLISFLNTLLHGEQEIRDISFRSSEHLGITVDDRKSVFDVYCENEKGEKFIVEMQNASQPYFKDRSVFYATFPISEQARKGDWNFQLTPIYTVGILNFIFDHDKEDEAFYHHEVQLMEVNRHKTFYNKLTFIYLEMPKFKKKEDELETMFDKWLFVLQNLSALLDRPAALQERVFERLFKAAEIGRFSRPQRLAYEESLKIYRDNRNVIDFARWEGEEKGRAKGRAEGLAKGLAKGLEQGKAEGRAELLAEIQQEKLVKARQQKAAGFPMEVITQFLDLTEEEIHLL